MAKHLEKELLSQLEAISNIGIWELDIKSNNLYWSDGIFKICGYEPQEFEVTFEKNLSIIHPDDREFTISQIENTKATGKEFDVRKRLVTKQGKIKYVNSKAKLIKDQKGKSIKVRGTFQDITNTVELETAYRKIQSDLEALIENTPDIIYSIDLDFKLLTYNSAFKNIINSLERREIKRGIDIFTLYSDEKRELYSAVFLIVKEGKRYAFEDELIINGESVFFDVSVNPILNQDNEVIGVSVFSKDITDKNRKERELETIKINQDNIINGTSDIIWSINNKFELITANTAFYKAIKAFHGESIKPGDSLIFQPNSENEGLFSMWKNLFQRGLNGESFTFDHFDEYQGYSNYSIISFSPMFNEKQEVWGVACYSKNVTQEKLNFLELEKKEQELKKIMNSSLDVICTFNKNNEFVKVNAASEKVWGYKPEELVGRNYDFLVHPDDINLTDTTTEEIQEGVNVLNFENRNIKKDGTIISMLWSANYDEKEEVTYCVAKDVSAIKKTEEKLKLSEQYFKNLIQNGGDLVGILNTEGDYLYVSPSSHAILGISSEDLIGKNCFSFMHTHDKDNIEQDFTKLSTSQRVQFEPFRFKHNDGSWLWLEAIGTNLLDDTSINGIVINARDITYKINRDKELENANKTLKNAQKITKMGNWEYNLATDELFWSDEIYEIFEIKRDINKKMSFNDFGSFIHPDDISKVINAKNITVATGEILDVQHRVITKNKKEKFVKELAEKIFNKETNSFWLLGTIRDNTDAILNQNKIETSEKKYKHLFDNNPSVMFLFDFETLKIIDCNQESLELYGYTREEFLNLTIKDIRPEEDIDLINKVTKNEETYGEIHKDLWRHKKKNGDIIYVNINGHLIDYEGRRCSLVLVTDITEKIETEKAIKASEQQKELIMNAALDGIICIDKNGDVQFWNPQAEKIFDWKSDEVIGKNLTQLIVPHQHRSAHDAGMKHYSKAKEGPVLNTLLEFTALNKSGKEFPIELTVIPIKQGENEFFCAFIRDISERKAAEIEIKESENRYKLLFQNSPLSKWVYDLEEFRFQDVNQTAISHYGYSRDEFLAMTLKDIRPKEDIVKLIETQKKIKHREGVISFGIFNHLKKDKTIIKVEVAGQKIYYLGKECMMVVCIDVTEREQAIEQLKEKEQELSNAQRLSKLGNFSVDVKTGKFSWSDELFRIFDIDEETFLANNSNLLYLIDEKDRPRAQKISEHIRKTGDSFNIEYGITTAKGEKKIIQEIGYGEKDEKGKVIRLFGTAQDITERKQAEELIKESEVKYRTMIESSMDAILLTVKNGEILTSNAAASQIFQMTSEEIKKAGTSGLVDISDPRLITLLAERKKTGKARGELNFKRKDGTNFPGEITSVVFNDARGEEKTSMIIRDISFQKMAEKEILESNQRFDYVTKATSDAIWDWDLTTDLIYWGDGFFKILGYEKSVIEPDISSWTNRIHPDDYQKIIKGIHACINDLDIDDNWSDEYRFLKSDGTYAFIQDKGLIIRNEKHEAIRMVGAIQDITHKKEEDLRLKLLESVVTHTNDAILITEAEPFDEPGPRILYVNEAFTKMTGYTANDVIGKTPRILQGPKTDKKELKKLGEALRNFVPCQITTINYKKSGEEFYINLSVSPVADSKGWYTHWIAIERDVTESILAQQKLKSIFDERNAILKSINDAFFTVDKNWIVNYWNYHAEKMLNKTKKQVIGNNLWEVFSDYSKSSSFEKYNQALEKNITINFEEYNETLDEWYDISIYPSETGLSVYLKDITERKHLQQQFESVINNMPGITYRCKMDDQWTMLYMSDGVFEVTGFPADNFVNSKYRTFASIIHYEDLMTTYNIDEALYAHEVFEIEYRIICADGSTKWVQDKGRGVYSIDNILLYIDGVIMDITDRKNSQHELERAYQEKNDVLESIDDGFFAIDNNSLVTYWNKKAEELLGEKRENVIGKNLFEMFARPDTMAFHDHYQLAIKENKTVHFEEYSVRSKKWFEVSAFASENGLSVYFKDVTNKKTIEEEIKAERNLLRTLIDNLPDTIYVKDALARKVISNKNDYNLIGFEHEEDVIGKTDLELFNDKLGKIGYDHDLEIIKTGEALINFEQYFENNDGSPLWLLTTKVPLKNNENKIVGILGIGRDITDIKIAQENIKNVNIELEKNINQLQISNKELEQFAYVASHDLQEPLRMVTSFLTQIEKKYGEILDEKGKQYIHFAVDGAKRMRQMILDLLEFSRVGRDELNLEEIDLNDIIAEIQLLYKKQIDEVSAKIITNDLPKILTFKTPIRQVLQNLISNALKYHTKGIATEINIKIKDKGIYWLFAIKDNGIGISDEYSQKIFVIFQRLHNKDEYAGTGIGLAICKKIIENLGGIIWVKPNKDKGSCFYFTVPKTKI